MNTKKISAKNKVHWWHAIQKNILFRSLKKIKNGYLEVSIENKKHPFGDSASNFKASMIITDARFFLLCLFHGEMGFALSYLYGYFYTPDLTSLLTLFGRNIRVVDNASNYFLSSISSASRYMYHQLFQQNSLTGSQKNIHLHYDLDSAMFACFLDKNMQYSSAIFPTEKSTLGEAQLYKMQTICERLKLSNSDHVLEIGSGWGGLAVYMARTAGCKVTTITISKKQFEYTNKRIQREGLQEQVSVLFCDYRNITGQYDKLVSIEMIEAVGHHYYQAFFDVCHRALKPRGLFLMQAILITDSDYVKSRKSVDFIKKFIFPGSNYPSLSVLNECANKSGFRLDSYHDITSSYAKTLAHWQSRFSQHSEQLLSLGYDPFFQRMWNYYFSYSQAAFLSEHARDAHIIFKKR